MKGWRDDNQENRPKRIIILLSDLAKFRRFIYFGAARQARCLDWHIFILFMREPKTEKNKKRITFQHTSFLLFIFGDAAPCMLKRSISFSIYVSTVGTKEKAP